MVASVVLTISILDAAVAENVAPTNLKLVIHRLGSFIEERSSDLATFLVQKIHA